jgi:hypothetical protein
MPEHNVGTREEWKAAVEALHEREQELGKLDEELGKQRQEHVKPDEASGDVRRGTLRKLRLPRPVDKSQGSFWFQPRRLPSRTLRHRQCLGSPPM